MCIKKYQHIFLRENDILLQIRYYRDTSLLGRFLVGRISRIFKLSCTLCKVY